MPPAKPAWSERRDLRAVACGGVRAQGEVLPAIILLEPQRIAWLFTFGNMKTCPRQFTTVPIDAPGSAIAIATAGDGTMFAVAGDGITLYCPFDGSAPRTLGRGRTPVRIAAVAGGRMLVSQDRSGELALWDVESGEVMERSIRADEFCVSAEAQMAIIRSGRRVVAYDLVEDRELGLLATDTFHSSHGIAISTDGSRAVIASPTDLSTWDLERLAKTSSFDVRSGWHTPETVAISPDACTIAFATNNVLRLLDREARSIRPVASHPEAIELVAHLERFIVVASQRELRVWLRDELATTPTADPPIERASIARDGGSLNLQHGARLAVWDVGAAAPAVARDVGEMQAGRMFGPGAIVTRDGRTVLTRCRAPGDKAWRLVSWSTLDGTELETILTAELPQDLAGELLDDRWLARRTDDLLVLRDLRDGETYVLRDPRDVLALDLRSRTALVRRVPHLELVDLVSRASTLRLDDVGYATAASFSGDDILAGTHDGELSRWSRRSGACLERSRDFAEPVRIITADASGCVFAAATASTVALGRAAQLLAPKDILRVDAATTLQLDDAGHRLLVLDAIGRAVVYDIVSEETA